MPLLDYFKPVSTITTEEVRAFLDEHDPSRFNLVVVRQPGEYEEEHLPGASLIPLGELEDRSGELDPGKPTIAYCASGGRSRAAAGILERKGFSKAFSMAGGIHAWQGLTAEGSPEAGIAWFTVGTTAADMASLAWALEENTRLFYTALAGMRPGTDEADLFLSLVDAEEHHKKTLDTVHSRLTEQPVDRFYRDQRNRILEGGMRMDTALKWAEGKSAVEVLRLSMGLEANAHDRYLKMMGRALDEDSRDVFETVAREERGHLKGLAALMDENIGLEEGGGRSTPVQREAQRSKREEKPSCSNDHSLLFPCSCLFCALRPR